MTTWLVRPRHFDVAKEYPNAPTVEAECFAEARLLAVLRYGSGMTVIHPLTLAVARQDESRWKQSRKRSPYVYAAEIRETNEERQYAKRRNADPKLGEASYIEASCVVCQAAYQTLRRRPCRYCSERCRIRHKHLTHQAKRMAALPKKCACGGPLRTDRKGTVYGSCAGCHGKRIRDAYERRQLQREAA